MSIEMLRQVARYLDGDRATARRFALICSDARSTDMPAVVLCARLVEPPDPPDYAALVAYGIEHAAFELLSRQQNALMAGPHGYRWADIRTLPEMVVHRREDGVTVYGLDQPTAVTANPDVVVADRLMCSLWDTVAVGEGVWYVATDRPGHSYQTRGWQPATHAGIRSREFCPRMDMMLDRWLDMVPESRLLTWLGPIIAASNDELYGALEDLDAGRAPHRTWSDRALSDLHAGLKVCNVHKGSTTSGSWLGVVLAVEINRASLFYFTYG